MKLVRNLLIILVIILLGGIIEPKAVTVTNFPGTLSTVQEGAILDQYHATWFHYKYNDDYAIICTEINNENTPVGHSCSINNDWTTATRVGVAAIIEAANLPAGNGSSDTAKRNYYYAQTTINRFLYNVTGDSINEVNINYIDNNFLTAANEAVARYNTTFNISLAVSSTALTSNGTYFISPIITVNGSHINSYNPSVGGGAEIYERSGNTFRIRILKSTVNNNDISSVNLSVTADKKYTIARNYYCGSSVQKVTPNAVKDEFVEATATRIFSIPTGDLEITKKDESGANLAGAVLRLYKGNDLIDEWTTTTSSRLFEDLVIGEDYKIVEVSAPEGYIKSNDINNITITTNNKTAVNVTNKSIEITINKVDTKNGSQLITTGTAQFKLYYMNGDQEVSKTISTTNGTIKVTNSADFKLIAGKTYYLQELSAPAGYTINTEVLSFVILANDTQVINFGNFATKLIINKYIKDTTTRLKDAKIRVCRYNDDTELYDICNVYITDLNALIINSLPLAKYKIKEIEAPTGYLLDETEYDIEITEDDNEQTINIYNEEVIEEIPKTGASIWILIGSSILLISIGSILYIKNKKKFT